MYTTICQHCMFYVCFPAAPGLSKIVLKSYEKCYSGIFKLECMVAFFVYQIDLEIVFPVGDVIDNIEPLIVFRWERRRLA